MAHYCISGQTNYFLEKNIRQAQLYIGVNAGKIISKKIDKAKSSIKVVSPYFGKSQIEQLLQKQQESVSIRVISTDGNNDFRDPARSEILKKIIRQEKKA